MVNNSEDTSYGSTSTEFYLNELMLNALGLKGVTSNGASITLGLGGNQSVYISTFAGVDDVVGSSGDDLIVLGGGGVDTVNGGAGRDHVIGSVAGLAGAMVVSTTAGEHTVTLNAAGVDAATMFTATNTDVVELRGDSSANNVKCVQFYG